MALYPLPLAVVGAKADKSRLFDLDRGEAGTPIIKAAPLSMECTVADVCESPNYEYLQTGDVLGKCLSFKQKG